MLNSFWGKCGEKTNKSKVEQVVQTLRVCTDEVLEVVYQQTEDNDAPNPKTNIFIACFTAYHARLKLYRYLKKLNEQVFYYDTDSVIYKWRDGQSNQEP